MALTNDPAPRRKPGRPRKVAQAEPELETRADLEAERELERELEPESGVELEPEYATYRYIGPIIGWVVTVDGTYEVRPNDELMLAHAEHLESNPNFVRVAR